MIIATRYREHQYVFSLIMRIAIYVLIGSAFITGLTQLDGSDGPKSSVLTMLLGMHGDDPRSFIWILCAVVGKISFAIFVLTLPIVFLLAIFDRKNKG
ncbi:MAG: hypothetical protein JWO54_419 [Candidatus Saccharibacteria bacterium]|nr:hypothetical protein [Candidatus Saccharibacteria bacterium]